MDEQDEEGGFDIPMTVRFNEKQIAAIKKWSKRTGVKASTLVRIEALKGIPWEDEPEQPKRK